MSSLSPALRLASPTALLQPSPKITAFRPSPSTFLQRPTCSWPMQFRLSSLKVHGFSRCHNARFLAPRAINVTAGQSDGPGKVDLDGIAKAVRKLWESFPQPVKSFPWAKALESFYQLISELTCAVAKYLCIPLLAVSSLSEMSYCAHERKMAFIPIPLLVGFAVAGVLRDTALELSPDLKAVDFPWHLLLIAIFFTLLKLLGPYYPYWGRLIIPHFANGGLWRTIWLALMWYRSPHGAPRMTPGTSVAENPSVKKA